MKKKRTKEKGRERENENGKNEMKRKRKWVGEKQEKKYEAWIKKRRKGRGRVISGKKLDIGNKRKRLTKGRDGEDEPQKI